MNVLLTNTGGHKISVNTDVISSVQESMSNGRPCTFIKLTDGFNFYTNESVESIHAKINGDPSDLRISRLESAFKDAIDSFDGIRKHLGMS
jgi:hypothetical protein